MFIWGTIDTHTHTQRSQQSVDVSINTLHIINTTKTRPRLSKHRPPVRLWHMFNIFVQWKAKDKYVHKHLHEYLQLRTKLISIQLALALAKIDSKLWKYLHQRPLKTVVFHHNTCYCVCEGVREGERERVCHLRCLNQNSADHGLWRETSDISYLDRWPQRNTQSQKSLFILIVHTQTLLFLLCQSILALT